MPLTVGVPPPAADGGGQRLGWSCAGTGIYFVVKGVRASFHGDLEPRDVGPISVGAIVAFGRVGGSGVAS